MISIEIRKKCNKYINPVWLSSQIICLFVSADPEGLAVHSIGCTKCLGSVK